MRSIWGWAAAALLAAVLCVPTALTAAAAADEVDVSVEQRNLTRTAQSGDEADTQPGPDRRLVGRESSERVDAVVIALWTIAAVMAVLLGLFLWHTSPRRRLRLAAAPAHAAPGEPARDFDETADTAEAGRHGESEPGADSSKGGLAAIVGEALGWLRSRLAPRSEAEPAVDGSSQKPVSGGDVSRKEHVPAGDVSRQMPVSGGDVSSQKPQSGGDVSRQEPQSGGDGHEQESNEGLSDGESDDESAVWKFGEANGEQRSV